MATIQHSPTMKSKTIIKKQSHPASLLPLPRFFHSTIAGLFVLQGLFGFALAIWVMVKLRFGAVAVLFFTYSVPSLATGMLALRISKDFKSKKTNWLFFFTATFMGMLAAAAGSFGIVFYRPGKTLLLWVAIAGISETVTVFIDFFLVGMTRNWKWNDVLTPETVHEYQSGSST